MVERLLDPSKEALLLSFFGGRDGGETAARVESQNLGVL